ncbi:hypothetical protein [Paenibacillus sp. GP183]|jgi:hypothetical protein|uniref:hypothetical protein n=1 Tax=Paenibacillus sp. GP183 TaxID=1882751 RepID=UPI000895F490|nr:hypothetical protein [Paenibacillus sp. GP183]SEB99138.1 hypothetical protein SAMN05443246_2594 [Paenibacillus sp. GP183]
MSGKKKEAVGRLEVTQRDRSLPDGTRYEESKIRLDKPIQKAVLGTTTLTGKQKI